MKNDNKSPSITSITSISCMLVWLASWDPLSLGCSRRQEFRKHNEDQKEACRFPSVNEGTNLFVLTNERLSALGLPPYRGDDLVRRDFLQAGNEDPYVSYYGNIVGAAALSAPGYTSADTLRLRRQEHRLSHTAWHGWGRDDILLWDVLWAGAFEEPQAAIKGGVVQKTMRSSSWKVAQESLASMLQVRCKNGATMQNMINDSSDAIEVLDIALSLPGPLAILTVSQAWQCVCCSRPRNRSSQKTGWTLFQRLLPAPELHAVDDALEVATVVSISDLIRDVSAKVPDDARPECERLAVWMDRLEQMLNQRCDWNHRGNRGNEYPITFLLNCAFMSGLLHQNADMTRAIAMAMKLYLPKSLAESLMKRFGTMKTPSPATMSRFQLTLDVGYMLWWREFMTKHLFSLAEGLLFSSKSAPVYLLADSSPQGGKDWFMVEWNSISYCFDTNFWEVGRSNPATYALKLHNELMDLRLQCKGLDPESDEAARELSSHLIEQIAKHSDALQRAAWTHCLPAMSLGMGHTTVDDKMHALLFALHHESGRWKHVRSLINSCVSITSDWGTEAHLQKVPNVDLFDVFPYWCEATFFDDDLEEPVLDGGGPAAACPAGFFDEEEDKRDGTGVPDADVGEDDQRDGVRDIFVAESVARVLMHSPLTKHVGHV